MKNTLANLYETIKKEFKKPFIKNTFGEEFRIYLYLRDRDSFKTFTENAVKEGISFGDGKNLIDKKYDDVIALNEDMTVNYVGMFGHQDFNHPEVASRYIFRIDYAKYIAGEKNYNYQPTI